MARTKSRTQLSCTFWKVLAGLRGSGAVMIKGTEAGKCFKLGQVTEAEEMQKGGISPIRMAPSADAAEGRRRRCPAPTPQTKCVTPQMVHDDAPDGAPAPRGWPRPRCSRPRRPAGAPPWSRRGGRSWPGGGSSTPVSGRVGRGWRVARARPNGQRPELRSGLFWEGRGFLCCQRPQPHTQVICARPAGAERGVRKCLGQPGT